MKRPRKFLILILFLLAINTLFFLAWYALDVQDLVKGIVEREAGKALKGRFSIENFTISDQQVYAEGITFAAHDSVFNFKVKQGRVRYNLLKVIFSGFRLNNLVDRAEIDQAEVVINAHPKPGPKKPRKKLEIPDLTKFFNRVEITNSQVQVNVRTPIKITREGMLTVSERLEQVNGTIVNARATNFRISASSANRGSITAFGVMDNGRLAKSHAEIRNYVPLFLSHPEIRDVSSEVNLVANCWQEKKYANLQLEGEAILWNTSGLLFDSYPVQMPLLTVKYEQGDLSADLATSKVGSSTVGGNVILTGLKEEPSFGSSLVDVSLDLGMFVPGFEGLIEGSVTASGKLNDPIFDLSAGADQLSYRGQTARNLALQAAYEDEEVTFALNQAVWENQTVDIAGSIDTHLRQLLATVNTTPISLAEEELKISGGAEIELTLYEKLPQVNARIQGLSVARGKLDLQDLSGNLELIPRTQGEVQNYYVNLDAASPDGTEISLVGDLLDRNLLLDGKFNSLALRDIYPLDFIRDYDPVVNGELSAFLTGSNAVLSTKLDLGLNSGLDYNSGLDLIASYDIDTRQGNAILKSSDGSLNGQPLDFHLVAGIDGERLSASYFKLNEQLFLSGNINLKDLRDAAFEVNLSDLDLATIKAYFPDLELPEINGIDLSASYNRNDSDFLSAALSLGEVKIPGLKTLSAELNLQGYLQQVEIAGGISNPTRRLIEFSGTADLREQPDLRLRAVAEDLAAADLMYSPLASGSLDCDVGFYATDVLSPQRNLTFSLQAISDAISIPDVVDLEDILIDITQTENLLLVDTLAVRATQFASVKGSGALDYNLLSNAYFEGGHTLNLDVEGSYLDWLVRKVDMITSARGNTHLTCSLQTWEDQFMVQTGRLDIENGRVTLKDQPEAIRNLDVQAIITNNQVSLENFTCLMGDGKLTVKNSFEDDPGSHLTVGFLDLGILSLRIDQPGAKVAVPYVTVPRTLTNLVLQGQDTAFATVKGPFDDMEISAEVLVYNAQALFPPDTNNLLNLIYSFRSAIVKPEAKPDPLPLPFTMDLKVRLMDNVSYTTYPTNFKMQPGGFLHIVYTGSMWRIVEANFVSEEGTIDFFGNLFQTEKLNISIIESQNLLDINGSFYRRSGDGTIITLSVNTDTDTSKPIFERLTFTLKSDNPLDTSTTKILSRLRFNSGAEELTQSQEGSLLQDQALNLISGNLDTSLVAPFLYPLENTVRRWLRLDNFSINAGFIQNLFTEYSKDPSQLAEKADMDQFMSDIVEFSSSILLNNLSVSLSKYLGGRFFLDYTLTLEETADPLKTTATGESSSSLQVSHDTSLRWFLPAQFRLTYTFNYKPPEPGSEENLLKGKVSHEVMLQRSFRFWGL